MVRRPKPPNPFRWVDSWPEVIRLVAMMYVRYPPSPRNVESLLLGARSAGGAPRHELLSICALVVNTVVGDREQWRRRWLDYRFMAEQLRPLRSLRALGAVRPRSRGGSQDNAASWTEWYVAAVWRSLPLPSRPPAASAAPILAESMAAHELDPQIAYHRANAARMHLLDERLHKAGTALFVLSLVCSLAGLCGYLADVAVFHAYGAFFTVTGAGLPTAGSALFGIRGYNDFSGVARAMAADLTERRDVFLDRKLAIPS